LAFADIADEETVVVGSTRGVAIGVTGGDY
jgi:hypothetical protein